MKEFYVTSNDETPAPKYLVASGYATMAFWRECDCAKNKCVAIDHLTKQGATVEYRYWNSQYLFNFSPAISIDEIRKAIYTAHDICRNCKKIKIR